MRRFSLEPGKTYMMHTSEPKTIVFTFVNPGHFRVNGQDVPGYAPSDLASPYTIIDGPFEYNGPVQSK